MISWLTTLKLDNKGKGSSLGKYISSALIISQLPVVLGVGLMPLELSPFHFSMFFCAILVKVLFR